MEEPLVFALTPRGGRWNHRYLVPRNCNVPQRKLLAIAEQACSGQSPHVVSVSREVQQPASGRPGREILIATDSRLREKSSPLHQAVEDCLRQYLIPLKDLVDRIDWDTEGRQLIVERDELSAWREEVCGVMRLSQQSEDGRGSTRVARRSPRFDVRRMLTVPVLCLSLCCPLILVITWYFLPFFSDSVNGQHPPGSSRLHEIPETTPRGQMPPLTELAIAVGIPSPPDDRLELLGRIRDRLREDAYMEIGSESRRQNSRNAEDDQRKDLEREASIRHVETDLKERLNYLKGVVSGNPDVFAGSLSILLRDRDLHDTLQQLFPRGDFDRGGLISETDSQKTLETLANGCDYSVIALLVSAARESEQLSDHDGDRAELARVLKRLIKNDELSPHVGIPPDRDLVRRYYVPQDRDLARQLTRWYADNRDEPILRKLTSSKEQSGEPESTSEQAGEAGQASNGREPGPDSEPGPESSNERPETEQARALIHFFCQAGRHFRGSTGDIFTESELRRSSELAKPDNSNAAQFDQALIHFLQACGTCSCGTGMRKRDQKPRRSGK